MRAQPRILGLIAGLALVVAVVGAACNSNGGGGGSQAAGGTAVSIVDNDFSPSNLTVKAGSTVTWTNNGSATHTATADDGSWDSNFLSHGATFNHTFASAGTFTFHCNVHSSMHGTITVTP